MFLNCRSYLFLGRLEHDELEGRSPDGLSLDIQEGAMSDPGQEDVAVVESVDFAKAKRIVDETEGVAVARAVSQWP